MTPDPSEQIVIAPSLLAANFTRLGSEVQRANHSGADWLHLDIMDGHFVPNISFGPAVVKAVRPLSRLPFDAHLMCERPEILLEQFAKAGANRITVHVELGKTQVTGLLWKIRSLGLQAGLSVNPPTAMESIEPHLRQLDSILVMTVNPGFGGQSFIKETLPKIQQARAWRAGRGLKYAIAVDGGINAETASECARAGANIFIAGTSLFKAPNMRAAIRKMRAAALKRFSP
jgi:ribulose-phosphate 3-epimerase